MKTHQFLARRTKYLNSSDPSGLSDSSTQSSIDILSNSDIISSACRVSAAGLDSLSEPELHNHKSMSKNDKTFWNNCI